MPRKKEGVSINQFISSAVSEKISALMTEDYLINRAKRAKKKDFRKILTKVPNRKPIHGDKLSLGKDYIVSIGWGNFILGQPSNG